MMTMIISENKMLGFLVKRIFVLFVVLGILSLLFVKDKWVSLAGLIIGSIFTLMRFSSLSKTVKVIIESKIDGPSPIRIVFTYVLNLLALIVLMAVSVKINVWLFGGITCGVLLVPFILTVNSFTEGLGITHNNFE